MEKNPTEQPPSGKKPEEIDGISRRKFLKSFGQAAILGWGALVFGERRSESAIPPATAERPSVRKETAIETDEIISGPDWVAESIPGHPELDPVLNLLRDVGRHAPDGSAAVWVGYDSESSPPVVGDAAGAFYYASGETKAGQLRLVLEEWRSLPDGSFQVTVYRFRRGTDMGYDEVRQIVVQSGYPESNARREIVFSEAVERLSQEEREKAEAAYRKAIAILSAADREKLRRLPKDFYYRRHRHGPMGY